MIRTIMLLGLFSLQLAAAGKFANLQSQHLLAEPKKAEEKPAKKADDGKAGETKEVTAVELLKPGAKMPLKAQEQGFMGKKVQHQDGETGLADWHQEYATACLRRNKHELLGTHSFDNGVLQL